MAIGLTYSETKGRWTKQVIECGSAKTKGSRGKPQQWWVQVAPEIPISNTSLAGYSKHKTLHECLQQKISDNLVGFFRTCM